MPFLDNIINGLNDQWIAALEPVITKGKIKAYGIAESIIDVSTETKATIKYPAIVDDDGEGTMIDLDDVYHLIWWHRLESIANTVLPKGFGDAPGDTQETVNMGIVVAAFRDKIRKPGYWIEAVLKDKMPSQSYTSNKAGGRIQRSAYKPGNSNFDKAGLLSREYTQVELNYPNVIFFEMKYQIINNFKKGCFDICEC